MMKHTPTPWRVEPLALGAIEDAGGNSVAQTQPRQALAAGKKDLEREANAAFIVKAVNAHEGLVEALRGILDRYTELVNCGDCGHWDPETEDEVKAARAALEGLE